MESRDRFGFIRKKAEQLGAERIGFIPAKFLDRQAAAEITSDVVWPLARTVIILAIRTLGNSEEIRTTEDSILNGMANRLAFWLTEQGVASIYMPCGDSVAQFFPHEFAADAAEWNTSLDGEYRMVSVLSSIWFDS